MANSVRWVIDIPHSFKIDPVRLSRRTNAKYESKLSSRLPASCEVGALIIEMCVLLIFVLLAVVALGGCFLELSQLLESNALGHVAAKALQGRA